MGLFDRLKHRRRGDDPRLHGHWTLVRYEDPAMDVGNGVEMYFSADGNLTYTINQGDRRQLMKLTYEISGSEIISNQPSAPAETRTRYTFDGKGQLVLELDGSRTWYQRIRAMLNNQPILRAVAHHGQSSRETNSSISQT
jgi:hypothetical protein